MIFSGWQEKEQTRKEMKWRDNWMELQEMKYSTVTVEDFNIPIKYLTDPSEKKVYCGINCVIGQIISTQIRMKVLSLVPQNFILFENRVIAI